ncbi:MAG: hypothetical protein HQ596_08400, partial [Candidatus Saganbacteria bacterium]|nr:hypothetical protein [Candidatus Saganbacteria bacterium]
MKYSTGRKTKMKYSTGMDWDEYMKKRRHSRVRYSTGESATLSHSSGTLLDGRAELEEDSSSEARRAKEEEKKEKKAPAK